MGIFNEFLQKPSFMLVWWIDSRLNKVLKAYFKQTAANVCEVEIMAFVLNISMQTVLEFQLDLVQKSHLHIANVTCMQNTAVWTISLQINWLISGY